MYINYSVVTQQGRCQAICTCCVCFQHLKNDVHIVHSPQKVIFNFHYHHYGKALYVCTETISNINTHIYWYSVYYTYYVTLYQLCFCWILTHIGVQTVCVRARLHMIFRNRSQKGHATIKSNGNNCVHQLHCSHTARSIPSNVYMLSMLSAFKKWCVPH